ncbi:hypothetical protein EXU48_10740 [Occultella glacieicola]|uniref:Uncharacterized protein n=1 Tax=Occultella glacieicola TaxID=2518684 RepID=A0ABY2E2W4_9MICO|nr:hypothetical protein [Occultella glacieicola]TDE93935.1 hypothetical protein EXU48_10740 [Occultella glacieicola]
MIAPLLAEDVPDPSVVTPGIGGFAVFFFLALVVFFLARGLGKHMRRARTNAAAQARSDAEDTADSADTADTADTAHPAGPTGSGDPVSPTDPPGGTRP